VHDDLKKTILIVEDNFELQNFLKQLLSDEYNILAAEDGAEGFEVAKRQFPDIILSDIMMPNLNGVELCKKLVEDKQTKHIPIIVLTAKNSTHAKLEALESGAIEFLQKPFNIKELQLKIKNNLTRRDQIISRYQNNLTHNPHLKNERSQDQIFLEKLNKIVNDNLNNTNFRIEELAEQINMSHSSLYRKCSSLTGMSVVDYIKQIRLKKAAILLVKYGYSISEVAYLVGFNNPKYFSNCFKTFFNKTPKKFKSDVLAHQSIDSYLKTYNIYTDVLESNHN
jgi:DNA-binding response OmpR family regulator